MWLLASLPSSTAGLFCGEPSTSTTSRTSLDWWRCSERCAECCGAPDNPECEADVRALVASREWVRKIFVLISSHAQGAEVIKLLY